jgi:hypothetical protein
MNKYQSKWQLSTSLNQTSHSQRISQCCPDLFILIKIILHRTCLFYKYYRSSGCFVPRSFCPSGRFVSEDVLSLWMFCPKDVFVPGRLVSGRYVYVPNNRRCHILSWGLFLACRRKLCVQCYSIIYNVQYLTCRVLQHKNPVLWAVAFSARVRTYLHSCPVLKINFPISYKKLAPPLPTSQPFKPLYPHICYNFNKQKTTLTHQNSSRSDTVGKKYIFLIPWTLWRIAKNWNS